MDFSKIQPKEKASIISMSLKPHVSAEVFSHLPPEDVQTLTKVIATMPTLSTGMKMWAMAECVTHCFPNTTLSKNQMLERLESEPEKVAEYFKTLLDADKTAEPVHKLSEEELRKWAVFRRLPGAVQDLLQQRGIEVKEPSGLRLGNDTEYVLDFLLNLAFERPNSEIADSYVSWAEG